MIFELGNEFGRGFTDFQKFGVEFGIVSSPFTTDSEKALDAIQLQLVDLQCDPKRNSNLKVLKNLMRY